MDRSAISSPLLRELHRLRALPLLRLPLFLGLYLGAAGSAVWLAPQLTPIGWLGMLPLYLLAAASLHGISLFAHEAVHSVLSRRRWWNHLLGAACALPVLQNFAGYRVLHLAHHAHLGQPGDPDHYPNLTQRPGRLRTLHWTRLLLGYPIYVAALPFLGWRRGTSRDRLAIAAEVCALALVITSVLVWGPGFQVLLHAWLLPMLCVHFLVNLRGMSQHTLLEHANDALHGSRSIRSTPWGRFFLCNENYHLEHHLYPAVPWYNLPRLHHALLPMLEREGAPRIPSYLSFLAEFLRTRRVKPAPEPVHA